MHKVIRAAIALLLAAGIIAPADAAPPVNVIQLAGKLDDPAAPCNDQRFGGTESGYFHFGYSTKEFINLNYKIAVGDSLEYEVLVPQTSTLHGGAVDGDFDNPPRSEPAGRATIRDSFVTEDQNGLFAHPATSFDILQ